MQPYRGSCQEAAAAHGNDHGSRRRGRLLENLLDHGSLAGDRARVVKGVNVGRAMLARILLRRRGCFVEGGAHDDLFDPTPPDVRDASPLLPRGRGRQEDLGMDFQLPAREGHALGVVSGRCAHNARFALFRAQT